MSPDLSQEALEETLKKLRDGVIDRLDQVLHLRKNWASRDRTHELGKQLQRHLDALEVETRNLERLQSAYQVIIATNGVLALGQMARGAAEAEDQDDGQKAGGYHQ